MCSLLHRRSWYRNIYHGRMTPPAEREMKAFISWSAIYTDGEIHEFMSEGAAIMRALDSQRDIIVHYAERCRHHYQ